MALDFHWRVDRCAMVEPDFIEIWFRQVKVTSHWRLKAVASGTRAQYEAVGGMRKKLDSRFRWNDEISTYCPLH